MLGNGSAARWQRRWRLARFVQVAQNRVGVPMVIVSALAQWDDGDQEAEAGGVASSRQGENPPSTISGSNPNSGDQSQDPMRMPNPIIPDG